MKNQPTTEIYTEGRWVVVEIDTGRELTKRRHMLNSTGGEETEAADHVEHYRYDRDNGCWVLHGPCWSPGRHEEWVDGELVSSTNVDDGYRMRTVAGVQVLTEIEVRS